MSYLSIDYLVSGPVCLFYLSLVSEIVLPSLWDSEKIKLGLNRTESGSDVSCSMKGWNSLTRLSLCVQTV